MKETKEQKNQMRGEGGGEERSDKDRLREMEMGVTYVYVL